MTQEKAREQADIGMIGLAVMGENLVLNMESRGYTVAVFNRTVDKVVNFVKGRAQGKKIIGIHSLPELVQSLKKPRRLMSGEGGQAVDDLIEKLLPLLDKGDISSTAATRIPDRSVARSTRGEGRFSRPPGSRREEGAARAPSCRGDRRRRPHVKPISRPSPPKGRTGPPCALGGGRTGATLSEEGHNGIEYGDCSSSASVQI